MAIRYTPEYNRKINRIVKNYNEKVRKANREGNIPKSKLPNVASVKNLKRSYSTRKELDRELKNLEMFGRKSIRNNLLGDKNITQYDLNLIKENRKSAIEYFQNIVDVVEPKIKKGYYAETERVDLAKKYIDILNQNPNTVDLDDLKTMLAGVNKYRHSHEIRSSGYRGFLTVVDYVFSQTGVSEEQANEFFKKLSVLDENEFFELYENNDLIERIYDLADSPEYGEMKLNMILDDAKERVDALLGSVDTMIAEIVAKRKK